MDLGSILLGLALLLLVGFLVARPLLVGGQDRERAARGGQADTLLFERERLLAQLRDLDFDHATSKIADDDYTAQRAALVAQGVAVLKQLDALGISAAPANGSAAGTAGETPEDEIEAAIAAARGRMGGMPVAAAAEAIEARVRAARAVPPTAEAAGLACGECGAAVQPADRFCPKCGAPQTLACPHCGRAARAGDQFCGGCGQRLPAVGALN